MIAVARTQGALEELDDEIRAAAPGASATLVPLDLTDFDALDRLGRSIFDRWGRLDALLGNAGTLGPLSPLPHISPKAFDEVFARQRDRELAADPLARPAVARFARRPRAFLTSGAASRAETRAYWGLYAASKAALDLLARTYAAETVTTPVKVMLVNPGRMRTRMRAAAMPGEDPRRCRRRRSSRPSSSQICRRNGPRRASSTTSRPTRC